MEGGLDQFLARARDLTDRPLTVGFGISTPAHVANLSGKVDGVIVGSAFIQICSLPDPAERLDRARRFVAQLADAARPDRSR